MVYIQGLRMNNMCNTSLMDVNEVKKNVPVGENYMGQTGEKEGCVWNFQQDSWEEKKYSKPLKGCLVLDKGLLRGSYFFQAPDALRGKG